MLDLNVRFLHQDERTALPAEVEDSGTSNSSLVNAEGCNSSNVGNADDDSVSAAGDEDSFHCFNFDILTVGDTGALLSNSNSNSNDEDRTSQAQSRSELVTRTLFPMSHGDGRLNLGHQVNPLQLFPSNSGSLEDQRLLQVPQKPTVEQNQVGKRSRRGPRSRSSQYRGVTFYRRTGRWESHIWDCGKQVYLGGFDTAHAAARAYDRAAIRFRGVDADINFNTSDYEEDMNQIKDLSKEDFVRILRRNSSGFSRGGSKHRGATMNKCGRWDPQTGLLLGKKACGNAAMESNGREAITNFETVASHYGNTQSLDLNLGISTSSCFGKVSSRNGNLEHLQLNHGLHDIRDTTTLKGLPVISECGHSWMCGRPTFFPRFEVPSNWAWQLHCQSQTSTKLLFTAAAASSGFPPINHDRPSLFVSTNGYNHQKRPPLTPPPAPPP